MDGDEVFFTILLGFFVLLFSFICIYPEEFFEITVGDVIEQKSNEKVTEYVTYDN